MKIAPYSFSLFLLPNSELNQNFFPSSSSSVRWERGKANRGRRERDFLLGMWGKGRRSTFRLEKEGKGGKCVLHFLPYSEEGKGFLECSEVGRRKFTEFGHKLSLKDFCPESILYGLWLLEKLSKKCSKWKVPFFPLDFLLFPTFLLLLLFFLS